MKLKLPAGCLYGESSRIHQIAGLRLAESTYPSGFETPKHSHEHAYFCMTLQGTSRQTYGRKTRMRETSTIVFYPPDEMQSEYFLSAGRIFSIELDSSWLQRFRDYAVIREYSTQLRSGLLTWIMTRLYREFHQKDPASLLAIEGLVLEIIAEASRRSLAVSTRQAPRWLERVRSILHEQFVEGVTLAKIAEAVGTHPVYVASAFRKQYECTIGEYVRRLKIESACDELSKSDAPLVQVALAAGFASQAHFSKTFRRLTGMTPTEYRANSRRS